MENDRVMLLIAVCYCLVVGFVVGKSKGAEEARKLSSESEVRARLIRLEHKVFPEEVRGLKPMPVRIVD